jgi:hypothetical protein
VFAFSLFVIDQMTRTVLGVDFYKMVHLCTKKKKASGGFADYPQVGIMGARRFLHRRLASEEDSDDAFCSLLAKFSMQRACC